MNTSLLIAALVFLIPMYITPGPNNVLCAVHGSQHGFRATLPLIFGMVIGWLIMGVFAAFTIDLLEQNTDTLYYLTIIGSSYMVYLSYKISVSKPLNDEEKESQILSPKTGLALQFVNGKAWIHDIVLLGSFGTIFGTGFLAKMSLIFFSIVLCLPFVMSWAAFGTLLRRIFTTPKSAILLNRIMGSSLFIVAIWLLLY